MIGGMLLFFLVLAILFIGIGLHLVGGLLKLLFRLVFCLPFAALCMIFGLLLCCTVICIPFGMGCFKLAGWIVSPWKPGLG